MVAVVLGLVHGEYHSGRDERVGDEAVRRVGGIDELPFAFGCEYVHVAVPSCSRVKGLCEAYADDSVIEVCGFKCKLAIAVQYVVDACQLREVVVHAHECHHLLLSAIYCQSLVLHTFRGDRHLGLPAKLGEQRVVGRCRLAFCGCHLYLGVEVCEERRHEVVESVEHAQHYHQCHCAHGDACHGDGGDEVDGVGALLREQVAARYDEGEVHYFFKSSSMCSM